jgi:peptidyl-prolyl cis-trans isomerase C
MKLQISLFGLLLAASFLTAKDVEDLLRAARRMCVNDSVPQALTMLEEEVKGEWSKSEEFLLQQEKADILLYHAGLPCEAYLVYTMLTKLTPPKDNEARLYYSFGLGLERNEEFRRAARSYEKVITEYPDSPFYEGALSAIERCFLKNYQIKVAEVDTYPITELELEEIASRKLSPSEQEHVSTPEGRKELMDRLIYERLLKLAAVREFAPVESTKVLIKLGCASCRAKRVLIPGLLSDGDLTYQIKKATREVMLRALYKKEVLDRIEITEKDKKRYYKENPKRFIQHARYTVREIVTDTTMLDSVLAALDAGIPFDSVAKLYSTASTKTRGGLTSARPLHTFPESMQPVIENLKPGSVSEPYETERGREILLLEAKTEETRTPYEEAKPSIEELLRREKIGKLSEEALERFREDAGVDSTQSGDTLARVAGRVILQADLDVYIARMPLRTPEQAEDTLLRKQALAQLIGEMVFDHELAQQKLYLSDSLSAITESRRTQLLVDAFLREEVASGAEPTDEEIAAYYKEHKKEFWRPEQVRVREILVTSADTAKMIYRLLQEGTRFDSLAKAYSEAETGPRSGYAGYIKKGETDKPYARQAFKLKEGKFSKPIQTEEGYWLITVEKKNEGYQRTLEESQAQIRSSLYGEKRGKAEEELKARLMAAARIVYLLDEQESSSELAPQERTPAGEEK